MTEREYRALPRLSYSWVKLFIEDRMDFYERFVLKVKKDIEETKDMIFGTLVDTLALSKHLYEERFVEASVSKPTGHMEIFLDKLWKVTLQHISAEGYITRDLTLMMEEAYRLAAFDTNGVQVILKTKPLDKLIAEWPSSIAEQYYLQQRACIGKYLIDVNTRSYAEKVVEELFTHERTAHVMNLTSNDRYSVFNQLIILFQYRGLPFKAMLDRVVVDHRLKQIQPYDLKTTFYVENFDRNYRKLCYYIQAALYYYALCSWKDENGMNDYQIMFMQFILAHSSCRVDPLLRPVDRKAMVEANQGFECNDTWHMGLIEAVDAIKWHQETGIWKISRTNFNHGGIVPIKTYGNYEEHVRY
jgi:hypothetical protein